VQNRIKYEMQEYTFLSVADKLNRELVTGIDVSIQIHGIERRLLNC